MAVAMAAGAVVFHVDIFIRQRCLDLVGKCTIALIERWWPQTLPAFEHCLLERMAEFEGRFRKLEARLDQ